MDIIGYQRKSWQYDPAMVEKDIVCGKIMNEFRTPIRVPIPVFNATIRLHEYSSKSFSTGHLYSTGSVTYAFESNSEDTVINVLKGRDRIIFYASMAAGFKIIINYQRGKCVALEDGWFTGTFTYAKTGSFVGLALYNGSLKKLFPTKAECFE